NQIEQITSEEIITQRRQIERLEAELAGVIPEITALKAALDGASDASESKHPQELRQALAERQDRAFQKLKQTAAAKQALASAPAKWSAEILKRNRKLILSEKVRALEILVGLSRAVIGVKDHRGPRILEEWPA